MRIEVSSSLYYIFQAEDRMEHCLEDQAKQAMRLLNGTGVSGAETLDQATYNERLQRASIFFNETLITCIKSKFLTVSC